MRDVYNEFFDAHGEIHRYTKKENKYRRAVYRDALNQCCWPGCGNDGMLEVHHILPIKSGGSDDYVNFIVLCFSCHRKHHLHALHIEKRLELLVYKFYIEKMELGFCSDEMDNEDFQLKCAKVVYDRQKTI